MLVLFFYIKGAADSNWHVGIIKNLIDQNCPAGVLKLIHSYLSDRSASFENVTSLKLENSCHQGGILSPSLWSININDLIELNIEIKCKFQGCTDDVCVVITGSKVASMKRLATNVFKRFTV